MESPDKTEEKAPAPEEKDRGFLGGIFHNVIVSFRLTLASFKLVFQYPPVLLLPFCTLLAVGALVVVPLSLLIWGLEHQPEATANFFELLYFITVQAAKAKNWGLAISSAIIETYILWCIWMIPVLTAVLYFTTVGMHVATQQIHEREPNMREGFRVANRNFGRILALAAFNATVYAFLRYVLYNVVRVVPVVGRWVLRGVRLALTAVTYLLLPIVVYERSGARDAFRSAWENVKKTWSGVLIGSGMMFAAGFALFEAFAWGLAKSVLDPATIVWLSLFTAAGLYAISTAVAAALRAVLYWYATTGRVPPGFNADDLPNVQEKDTFTDVEVEEVVLEIK